VLATGTRTLNPFKQKSKSQNGMAVLEMIPFLIVSVLLVNFCIGFFGIIHTGNMNGIAARNYLFETIRHRSNLDYHRNNAINYSKAGSRFGGITTDNNSLLENWRATARRLSWISLFGGTAQKDGTDLSQEPAGNSQMDLHNQKITGLADAGTRNENVEVYNVWIRSLYGICHTSKCGN
jgi:hypothetical protein